MLTATPATFGTVVDPSYKIPKHIKLLDDLIVQAAYEGGVRACVSIAPRHGKSMMLSTLAPAWYLMNNPDKRVMIASYNATLAEDFSRKARDLVAEYGQYLPNKVRPDPSNKSRNRWGIEGHKGELYAVGVGGSLTGRGADLLLLDDLIKSADDAASPAHLERLWDWLGAVAFTRLEPGGSIIIVGTVWSYDDPVSRIRRSFPDWENINLPAIAGDDDALGREPGEVLWPERFSKETLSEIETQLGPYHWNALYQGRPAPPDGSVFKREWFKYAGFDEPKREIYIDGNTYDLKDCIFFSAVDLAASTKSNADFTVIATFALAPGDRLVLVDLLRIREEPHLHPQLIERSFDKWDQSFILIEENTYGFTLLAELRDNYDIPTRGVRADQNKTLRAMTAAAAYNSGRVYHLADAPWLVDLENEMLEFPSSKHDDQVDALSYAIIGSRSLTNKVEVFLPQGALSSTKPSVRERNTGVRNFWD